MLKLLHLEDLHVGATWTSPSRVITANDVSDFATLTGDHNPLHLDEAFARESPFGRPIAHGLLGLSFVAGLSSESPCVDTVAFLGVHQWQFLKPVYFGDRVHVNSTVVEVQPQGRKRGRVRWKRALLNQHDQIVQQGIFETLVTRRAASQHRTHDDFQLQTVSN